mgnify:CR=1 FL=1
MQWINAIIQGILLGGLYALLAAGLSLMFGVMRIVNLAHGALAILAAYLGLVIVQATGISPFLALLAVVPIMAAVGYLLQWGVFNRALSMGGLSPLLAAFGLAVVVTQLLQLRFSADLQSLQVGSLSVASITITDQISIGVLPLIIRVFEFRALHVSWDTNAYGSIVWTLLGLHTLHIGTDLVDTVVLTALMFTRNGHMAKRFSDVNDNAVYWDFVVYSWLPLYAVIYWFPRLVG